jgi:NAD(P)H-nitrite reductase large subunit
MEKKTIVCRCEDLSLEEISHAIDEGFATPDEIKRMTRCGMGACQGRTCTRLVTQLLTRMRGIPPGEIPVPTKRPPLIPTPVKTYSGEQER